MWLLEQHGWMVLLLRWQRLARLQVQKLEKSFIWLFRTWLQRWVLSIGSIYSLLPSFYLTIIVIVERYVSAYTFSPKIMTSLGHTNTLWHPSSLYQISCFPSLTISCHHLFNVGSFNCGLNQKPSVP